jgi:hypothetical protein
MLDPTWMRRVRTAASASKTVTSNAHVSGRKKPSYPAWSAASARVMRASRRFSMGMAATASRFRVVSTPSLPCGTEARRRPTVQQARTVSLLCTPSRELC